MRGEFNTVESHQNPVVTSTGEERFISWHNAALYDNNGNIIGTLSSGEDITNLIESEEKFKTITEQSVASISIVQKNEILYINNVFSEVIGYPYKKIFSWEVDELLEKIVHPDDFERVMNLSRRTRAGLTDSLQNTHFKIIREDGEIRWIHSFFRSISYKSKPAALNFFLDITDQKIKERELIRLTEELEQKVEERTKKLSESEEKYRILADQSQIGIFIIQENQIKYINKIAAEVLGFTRQEVDNWTLKDFSKYIHPDDRNFMLEQALKKQEGDAEILSDYDFRFYNKNGDLIWGHNLSKTILYEGKPADLVTQVYITERKKIEQKLKESEEKFRKIFEAIPDLFLLIKKDSTIIDYSGNKEDFYVPPETFLGKKMLKILPENVCKLYEGVIEKLIKTKKPQIIEYELPMKGSIRYYEARLLYFSEDKIAVFIRDITEKFEMTNSLKKTEKEKSIILKSISELIVFQDINNTIIWVNKAAADSLNMQPEELIGHKCFELWHRRKEVCDACPIKKSIKSGILESGEITSPDGKIWSIKSFPVKDERGNTIGVVEVTSEITELKRAEEKIRDAQEHMNLYRSLFAHDINNIFSNIKLASELCSPYLNDPTKFDKVKELHQVIEEQIIRGDKLIKNVGKLTSLEDSKFPLKRENLNQILSNSIEFIYNSFPNREINVNKEIANKEFFVNANELLLDVFENILINSIKHNENPQVKIDIAVSKTEIENEKYLKIQFKDNGEGISDKRKQNIFQRQKAVKKGEGGMGLGLSLVKKIIDSYNGKIWVEDRVRGVYRKGSNFIVLIPEA